MKQKSSPGETPNAGKHTLYLGPASVLQGFLMKRVFPNVKCNLLSHNLWSLPSFVSSGTSETSLALLSS